MQVRRRSKVTGVKSGHQSWSQRVIEHGGQEAALPSMSSAVETARRRSANSTRVVRKERRACANVRSDENETRSTSPSLRPAPRPVAPPAGHRPPSQPGDCAPVWTPVSSPVHKRVRHPVAAPSSRAEPRPADRRQVAATGAVHQVHRPSVQPADARPRPAAAARSPPNARQVIRVCPTAPAPADRPRRRGARRTALSGTPLRRRCSGCGPRKPYSGCGAAAHIVTTIAAPYSRTSVGPLSADIAGSGTSVRGGDAQVIDSRAAPALRDGQACSARVVALPGRVGDRAGGRISSCGPLPRWRHPHDCGPVCRRCRSSWPGRRGPRPSRRPGCSCVLRMDHHG